LYKKFGGNCGSSVRRQFGIVRRRCAAPNARVALRPTILSDAALIRAAEQNSWSVPGHGLQEAFGLSNPRPRRSTRALQGKILQNYINMVY